MPELSWRRKDWKLSQKSRSGREEQYRREKEDRKRANIRQTLKTWDDTTEAEAYLENFEAIMREADIPEIDWPSTLRKQLAGRALSIFSGIVTYGGDVISDTKEGLNRTFGNYSSTNQMRHMVR